MLVFRFILLFFATNQCLSAINSSASTDLLQNVINKYVSTKEVPADLETVVREYFNSPTKAENASCVACAIVGDGFLKLRKSGANLEEMSKFLVSTCTTFTKYSWYMCNNYVHLVLPNILFIVDTKANLSIKRLCAIQLQEQNCVDESYIPWNITIPPGESLQLPEVNEEKQSVILHLTDIHFDLLYEAGSASVCNESLCCQKNSTGQPPAGYWGDYHDCDMPWYSVENLLSHIKLHHPNIDFVYYTGDIVNHKLWDTSDAHNSHYIRKLMQAFENTFGKIPVYPVLGNHEVHPVDYFSTLLNENLTSTQSLYNLVAEEWKRWLPTNTKSTIIKGGYYTVLVKPGFRIIGLNNNVCIFDNIWLAFNEIDPYDQLQWLANTLCQAEINQEAVHILAHIPPGHTDCFKQWNNEFVRIIHRFHNIIKGQFYGHTHFDELKVFYNNTGATNAAFIAGSFTSFSGINPTYRIYHTYSNHFRVLDYEQWIYNLSDANGHFPESPIWFKLYSFKEAYGVDDLTPHSLDKVLQAMLRNVSIVEQYQRFQVRKGPAGAKKNTLEYLANTFCSITNVNYQDSDQCIMFRKLYHV